MQAFLFDLDGTLAASERLKGQALANACASYGAAADYSIYAEVMGADWPTVTGHFWKEYQINPAFDEFNERFRDLYSTLIENELCATEGAWEFISEAKEHGVKVGVVSSAAHWMVDKILSKLGFQNTFDLVVTQEHVLRHKPDPEAYLLALAQLRIRADDVLVFEDSNAGVRAAIAAGCRCVAVRHAFNAKHDLSAAIRTIAGFTELLGTSRTTVFTG
jgi:HAD superfamily hydrolase (TIGR01509 family)